MSIPPGSSKPSSIPTCLWAGLPWQACPPPALPPPLLPSPGSTPRTRSLCLTPWTLKQLLVFYYFNWCGAQQVYKPHADAKGTLIRRLRGNGSPGLYKCLNSHKPTQALPCTPTVVRTEDGSVWGGGGSSPAPHRTPPSSSRKHQPLGPCLFKEVFSCPNLRA